MIRKTASDKVLRVEKHLILLIIQNIMDIKEVLLQWFINFSDQKSTTLANKSAPATRTGTRVNFNLENQELADELLKLRIRKFKNIKYVDLLEI